MKRGEIKTIHKLEKMDGIKSEFAQELKEMLKEEFATLHDELAKSKMTMREGFASLHSQLESLAKQTKANSTLGHVEVSTGLEEFSKMPTDEHGYVLPNRVNTDEVRFATLVAEEDQARKQELAAKHPNAPRAVVVNDVVASATEYAWSVVQSQKDIEMLERMYTSRPPTWFKVSHELRKTCVEPLARDLILDYARGLPGNAAVQFGSVMNLAYIFVDQEHVEAIRKKQAIRIYNVPVFVWAKA